MRIEHLAQYHIMQPRHGVHWLLSDNSHTSVARASHLRHQQHPRSLASPVHAALRSTAHPPLTVGCGLW